MLDYDLLSLVQQLARELRYHSDAQQRLLLRAIIAELSNELGDYVLNFVSDEVTTLLANKDK